MKLAIIGCGGIANAKHMPALEKLRETVEMAAFCDVVEEKAIGAARQYGASDAMVYTDYRQLLKDDSIDVVHVCTPNVAHSQITVDALEAGKHVMCEKPMAAASSDAEKMLDAARRTGKKLTIGYQNRFRDDVRIMHEACRNGDLGDMYFAKAQAVRRRAVPTWGVFTDKSKQGGGALIDIGTHVLDMTLWMMDNYEPQSVMGSVFYKMGDKCRGNVFGPWDSSTFNVEDSAFGFIKMANGATIYLEAAWILNLTDTREGKCTICGTEGGAEMLGTNVLESNLVLNSEKYGRLVETRPQTTGGVAYFSGKKETEADLEARQWIEAIRDDKVPLVKPEQAYVVTRILEAIYDSAQMGREIRF